ncbi:MAG TPA: RidA family protein [Bacillota bacterium]|nr:RidA family protein [Bacillota bacterium]
MIEKRIEELGYKLPEAQIPKYKFTTVLVYDGTAHVSGTLPFVDGKLPMVGKVGDTVSIEEGQKLAEICVLNMLANLKGEIGSLDKVKQIVKVTGFVASATGFSKQAIVMNGATDLLVDIFGEKGVHARSAVGAAVMPRNTPVEIEMTVALEE